ATAFLSHPRGRLVSGNAASPAGSGSLELHLAAGAPGRRRGSEGKMAGRYRPLAGFATGRALDQQTLAGREFRGIGAAAGGGGDRVALRDPGRKGGHSLG